MLSAIYSHDLESFEHKSLIEYERVKMNQLYQKLMEDDGHPDLINQMSDMYNVIIEMEEEKKTKDKATKLKKTQTVVERKKFEGKGNESDLANEKLIK